MKKIINEKLTGIGLLVLAAVFAMYAFLEYRTTEPAPSVTTPTVPQETAAPVKTEPTPSVTTPKPAPALASQPTPTPTEKPKPISTITILDIPSFEVGETRSIIAIAKDASGNLVADGTKISISFDSSVLRFVDAENIDTFQLYTNDGMVAISVIGLKIGASQVYATSGTKVASSLVRIISKAAISIAGIASTTVGGTTTIVATAMDDFGNLVPDGTQITVSVSSEYLLLKTSTGTTGSTVTVGSSNGRVTVTGIGLLAGNSQVVATAGTTVGSALSVVTGGSSTPSTPAPKLSPEANPASKIIMNPISNLTIGNQKEISFDILGSTGSRITYGSYLTVEVSNENVLLVADNGMTGPKLYVSIENGRATLNAQGASIGTSSVTASFENIKTSTLVDVVRVLPAPTPAPTPAPAQVVNTVSIQQPRISNSAVNYAYNRSDWGSGWSGSCPKTRAKVLRVESLSPVTYTSSSNCTVSTGTWQGPFTGTTFTRASDVDIDHMVPLKNAHISGGWQWSSAKKRDYYNYLGYANHLIAVDDSTNQSKSDRSPDQWKPPNPNYHCTYAKDWINIKNQWSLTVTSTEWSALQSMLNTCGQTFTYTPPTAPAPVAVAPAPPVQQPSVNITTTYPCESSDCNCSDFSTWQAAKDVLNRSLATYGTDKHRLDRDGDGSPCESLPGAP